MTYGSGYLRIQISVTCVRYGMGKTGLKVPKCEIFDRSDFDDVYTIKSLCEGDFGVKIKKFHKNI